MDLFCFGEFVVDLLPGDGEDTYIRYAGGAPANVAVAAARNGLDSGFCGKVGDDDMGRFLEKSLDNNNVVKLCRRRSENAFTTMALVSLLDGERSFSFVRKPGADMFLEKSDIPLEMLKNSTIVHGGLCSFADEPEASTSYYVLEKAKENNKIISFDVNYRDAFWKNKSADKALKCILPFVDLLKISDEEVDMIGGTSSIPSVIKENNISVVILTMGKKGSRCYWNNECYSSSAWGGTGKDTTGAGDAFWGGFLSSLLISGIRFLKDLNQEKVKKAHIFGSIASGLCVMKKGAVSSLPYRDETDHYFNQYMEGEI